MRSSEAIKINSAETQGSTLAPATLPEREEAMAKLVAAARSTKEPLRSKSETFNDAVKEQQEKGILYVGFEQDEDFHDLNNQLEIVFGKDLLNKCLIEKIVYRPDVVVSEVNGRFYEIQADKFIHLMPTLPTLEAGRFRAYNTSKFNIHAGMKEYARLPIAIYGFVGESLDSKSYLPQNISPEEKKKLYKLGTVVHEVAHSIYDYLLDDTQKEEWETINRNKTSLTEYSQTYKDGQYWLDEQFAEAIRIWATNPKYLGEEAGDIQKFIAKNLPNLGQLSLS